MCTVTYIPKQGLSFILTSNRDEAISRETLPPDFYKENGVEMLYPKDKLAGGTWIGLSDKNRLVCLLNGAFTNHIRKSKYRMSRGKIVSELLQTDNFLDFLQHYDLNQVEPFTVLTIDWNDDTLKVYELIWDETRRHLRKLDTAAFHIWSSSTLYADSMKQCRREWFEEWKDKGDFSQDSIIDFHLHAGCGDKNIDLQIDRGTLKTVSVSSVCKSPDELTMCYRDLVANTLHKKTFETISL
jgi:uncharacterized protein with NRDE domain